MEDEVRDQDDAGDGVPADAGGVPHGEVPQSRGQHPCSHDEQERVGNRQATGTPVETSQLRQAAQERRRRSPPLLEVYDYEAHEYQAHDYVEGQYRFEYDRDESAGDEKEMYRPAQ